MDRSEKLELLREKVATCEKCPVLAETRNKTVFGEGNPHAEVLFLGEAPGANEDQEGRPFVGKAGQLLTNILQSCGIRREDIYIANICKCRPPSNRVPSEQEATNCRPFLDLQLTVIKPKIIVCLGSVAAQNLLRTKTGISKLRGEFHEITDPIKAKVLCTWHPAYLLRNPAEKQGTWDDMQLLLRELNSGVDAAAV